MNNRGEDQTGEDAPVSPSPRAPGVLRRLASGLGALVVGVAGSVSAALTALVGLVSRLGRQMREREWARRGRPESEHPGETERQRRARLRAVPRLVRRPLGGLLGPAATDA
ncbi:MAG: hypothetical protein AAFO29_21465, partial [Actinomycetota bacterium]